MMVDVSSPASLNDPATRVLDEVLAGLSERMQTGELVDIDAVCSERPEYEDQLRRILPAMQALAELGHLPNDRSAANTNKEPSYGTIGDYQIIREVGRGGMGVVYEAEQISLGRRVALKVLPFAAVLDERQIKRFKNEALAAAQLDHPHIVDVYGVGCERAVHFYAMRFVEGNSLAEVIAHLRSRSRTAPQKLTPDSVGAETLIGDSGSMESVAEPEATALADTDALAALSTDGATDTREFFTSVARVGIEVSEALDHAHQQGVTHRDVKPANIIVDAAGKAWVTDFGLARLESSVTLTMSGDLLGTLRYMSPEQALAKRVVVDHRTDVYSLGVTLYELLALRPAFPDEDRPELLRKIAFEEPPAPGRLNPAVPVELETIVLKAISKNPSERYETAQELADDLRRFLEDKPIRARRPHLLSRAAKWSRRHRPFVWSAAICVTVAVTAAAGSIGWIVRGHNAQRRLLEQQVTGALDESEFRQAGGDRPAAVAAARRAEALIDSNAAGELWRGRVSQRLDDLEAIEELDRVRLAWGSTETTANGMESAYALYMTDEVLPAVSLVSNAQTHDAYAAAFRQIGIDVEALESAEAASRIRTRSVSVEMAIALDHWALVMRSLDNSSGSAHLLAIARLVDDDEWRNELRDMAGTSEAEREALLDLAAAAPMNELHPSTIVRLGDLLHAADATDVAADLLHRAHRRHPDDFWINAGLASYYYELAQWDEVVRFCTAAIALRRHSPFVQGRLGIALKNEGVHDEAIAACRESVRLNPGSAWSHASLGNVLEAKGERDRGRIRDPRSIPELEEAIREYRRARDLDPEWDWPIVPLANCLERSRRIDEAIATFRDGIRRNRTELSSYMELAQLYQDWGRWDESATVLQEALPHYDPEKAYAAGIRHLQGRMYLQRGQVDEAVAEFRESLRLAGDVQSWQVGLSHFLLGEIHHESGRYDEAIAEYEQSLLLRPDFFHAHRLVHAAIARMEPDDRAVAFARLEAHYREAILAAPDNPLFHNYLAGVLKHRREFPQAEDACREAIHLAPDFAWNHQLLGEILGRQDRIGEAQEAFREAVRLSPNDRWIHHFQGNLLQEFGRPVEAEAAYREAIRHGAVDDGHLRAFAAFLRHQGRLEEAESTCQEAIRLNPGDSWNHHTLGDTLHELDRLPEAVAAFREAARLNPGQAGHHRRLAAVLRVQGKLQEAADACRQAIHADPDDPENHLVLGDILRKLDRPADAEAAYRQAILLGSANLSAYHALGEILSEQDRSADAAAVYREATSRLPEHALSRRQLAGLLLLQERLTEAEQACRDAIRLNPGVASDYEILGDILKRQGRAAESVSAYRQAVELDSGNVAYHRGLASSLSLQGEFREAVDACQQAIDLAPDDSHNYRLLAEILIDQERLSEAETACRQAIRLDPDDALHNRRLAEVLRRQGKLSEAAEACQDTIRLDGENVAHYRFLGQVLWQLDRIAEAESAWREATRLEPANALYHRLLARTLRIQERLSEALIACQEALRLDPDDAMNHHALGLTFKADGRLSDGEAAFREAVRLDPAESTHRHQLATVLRRQGKLDEAITACREAVRLAPDDPAHQKLLDDIRKQLEAEDANRAEQSPATPSTDN